MLEVSRSKQDRNIRLYIHIYRSSTVDVISFLIYSTRHKGYNDFTVISFPFIRNEHLETTARTNPRGDEQRDIEIKSAPSRQDAKRGEHVESDASKRAWRRSTRFCESHTSAGVISWRGGRERGCPRRLESRIVLWEPAHSHPLVARLPF